MTIYVRDHRGDGTSAIVDSTDNTVFEIPTRAWPEIASLPNERQRAALEHMVIQMRQSRAAAQAPPTTEGLTDTTPAPAPTEEQP